MAYIHFYDDPFKIAYSRRWELRLNLVKIYSLRNLERTNFSLVNHLNMHLLPNPRKISKLIEQISLLQWHIRDWMPVSFVMHLDRQFYCSHSYLFCFALSFSSWDSHLHDNVKITFLHSVVNAQWFAKFGLPFFEILYRLYKKNANYRIRLSIVIISMA